MVEPTENDIQVIYSTSKTPPHPSELVVGGIAISLEEREIYTKNEDDEVISLSLNKYVIELIEMNKNLKLELAKNTEQQKTAIAMLMRASINQAVELGSIRK